MDRMFQKGKERTMKLMSAMSDTVATKSNQKKKQNKYPVPPHKYTGFFAIHH